MATSQRNKKPKPQPLLAAAEARVVGVPPPLPPRRKNMTRAQRFERLVDRTAGPSACHPWRGSLRNGYGQVKDVSPATGRATMRATHVVAAELAFGPKPPGAWVLHSDRCITKACCNPAHLRFGSPRENTADARRAGQLKGPKLNAAKVRRIVELHRLGLPRLALCERFDVSAQTIASILGGRTWQKVTGIDPAPRKGGRPRKHAEQKAPAPKLTKAQRRKRVLEALP